eukprot:5014855-Prorocentrum_lima.AAC.1
MYATLALRPEQRLGGSMPPPPLPTRIVAVATPLAAAPVTPAARAEAFGSARAAGPAPVTPADRAEAFGSVREAGPAPVTPV